jgi:hypothetical protein
VRTVPRVPTGMNTGVAIEPCSVVSRPARARLALSVVSSSNVTPQLSRAARTDATDAGDGSFDP